MGEDEEWEENRKDKWEKMRGEWEENGKDKWEKMKNGERVERMGELNGK